MNTQNFMNTIYDLIAQNAVDGGDMNHLTHLVDHVDTERNAIVFINDKGVEFELQLVNTYAPSSESMKGGL